MRREVIATLTAAMIAAAPQGFAQTLTGGADYSAGDLLSPCQEADNDARWGAAAEAECEQYLIGFVDALRAVDMIGGDSGICPPALNTADEVRWAFMRWVHGDYTARRAMSAAEAVHATLRESFPCTN